MVEAISVILGMAMLAALVAAIVGVVRGFRTKQWRLAIITGSIFGVLFVVVTVYMGATGQLDEETVPAEQSVPVSQTAQVAAPTPETAPAQASALFPAKSVPETTGGLGISRSEFKEILEAAWVREFSG